MLAGFWVYMACYGPEMECRGQGVVHHCWQGTWQAKGLGQSPTCLSQILAVVVNSRAPKIQAKQWSGSCFYFLSSAPCFTMKTISLATPLESISLELETTKLRVGCLCLPSLPL